MTRIKQLEQSVTDLYEARHPDRADWADWFGENHVFLVADYATELAIRYRANEELTRAAALLHDIADTIMSRSDKAHEAKTLEMARELLKKAGYSKKEIHLVVDDAIRLHSCHDGQPFPKSNEGKILATADAMGHLLTGFYIYAAWVFGKEGRNLSQVKQYVLNKLERDFNNKIQFNEIKEECRLSYNTIVSLFSR